MPRTAQGPAGEGPVGVGGRDAAGRVPAIPRWRSGGPAPLRPSADGTGVQGMGVWDGMSGRGLTPPPLRGVFVSETTE